MEFAVGVPGTVGGAVFMNAGADGQDTASALSSVECISPDGSERVVVDAADVRFGYRKSPFMRDDDDDDDDEKNYSSGSDSDDASARDSNSGSDDNENEKNYSSGSDSNSRGIGASSRDLRGWIVVAATFRVRADSRRRRSRARVSAPPTRDATPGGAIGRVRLPQGAGSSIRRRRASTPRGQCSKYRVRRRRGFPASPTFSSTDEESATTRTTRTTSDPPRGARVNSTRSSDGSNARCSTRREWSCARRCDGYR